ncbi:MAG TPA: CGNR zinc finger domain-containing protein [Streptosporangiaceae bacterium]|nr:CGNR zinc finger domain-containing protein [Streptosporangiaceae bacterium]
MVTAAQEKPSREAAIGPAPGRLELVRAFVNTLDIEAGTDELSSPDALGDWLRARDLAGPHGPRPTDRDLRAAVTVREGLRDVLAGHAPGQHPAPADGLRLVVSALPVRLVLGDDGAVRAVPDVGGPDGAGPEAGLAELLLIAAEAATAGTWRRLKVCGADDCRWAFYDRSPAGSGCWCSMAICGSRAKSRAFRRRAATKRRPAGRAASSASS